MVGKIQRCGIIIPINGPMCSKHRNLNTTDTCPGTQVLRSLNTTVVGSEGEGRDGDRTAGYSVIH